MPGGRDRRQRRRRVAAVGGAAYAAKKHHDNKVEEQYAQEAPPAAEQAAPVQPAADPYAQLTQLKELLDSGVLTQAEFDEQKQKILG